MSASLTERIEQGMTTCDDARIVASMIARLSAYEMVLREICARGTGDAAMLACRVLVGEQHEPARAA